MKKTITLNEEQYEVLKMAIACCKQNDERILKAFEGEELAESIRKELRALEEVKDILRKGKWR